MLHNHTTTHPNNTQDYGVVALWGMSPAQERSFVSCVVRPCAHQPHTKLEVDEFAFHYSATEPAHLQNDVITINMR